MKLLRIATLLAVAISASAATHIHYTLTLNDGVTPMAGKIVVSGPTGSSTTASTDKTVTIGPDGVVDFDLVGCLGCGYVANYRLVNSRGVVTKTFRQTWSVPDTASTLTIPMLWDGSPFDVVSWNKMNPAGYSIGQGPVWDGASWVPGSGGGDGGGAGVWGSITGTLANQADLTNALAGKSPFAHVHLIADVTGLQAALDAKAGLSHVHAIADVTSLQATLDAKELLSRKGQPNGYAALDSGGKVPAGQLPSSSGMTAVIQDTAPQLGGDLDMNGRAIQTVTPTEMARVHGVTSGVQAQIDGKAATGHLHTGVYEPVDATILRQANLAGSGAATTPARSDHNHTGTYQTPITGAPGTWPSFGGSALLNVGAAAGTVAAGDDSRLTNARTPTAHAASHASGQADVITPAAIGAVTVARTVAGHALSADVSLVKADVGLGNVDNTTDAGKPVSTAQQAALDSKAPLANPSFTGTVSVGNTLLPFMPPPISSPSLSGMKVISLFEGGLGAEWVTSTGTGTNADDPTLALHNNKSIKQTATNSATATIAKVGALDLSSYEALRVRVFIDAPANAPAVMLLFSNGNFTTSFSCYVSLSEATAGWNDQTIVMADCTKDGLPTWASIDKIYARTIASAGVTVNVGWAALYAVKNQSTTATILFTFDDGYPSVYTYARPSLAKYGYPATMFTIASLIGTASFMTVGQLQSLQNAYGWDIASHTFDHTDLSTLTAAQIDSQLSQWATWGAVNGFKRVPAMAYPYGNFNATVLGEVAKGYLFARTTHAGYEFDPSASRQYHLWTQALSPDTTLAQAKAFVDVAVAKKVCLIFMAHNLITGTPSNGNDWNASDFTALVDYIAGVEARVVTFSQLARQYFPTNPLN